MRQPVTCPSGRLVPLLGTLNVSSKPDGASVFLGTSTVAVGVTPLHTKVPVGASRVRIVASGCIEQTRDVRVEDKQGSTVHVDRLRAASDVATLTVATIAPKARVFLAGNLLGAVPVSRGNLNPGSYEVRIEADEHEAWNGSVALEAGPATRINADFLPNSRRIWPSWKWIRRFRCIFCHGRGSGCIRA